MTTIQKWGNSLAVRIPVALADQLEVEAGTPVDIGAENGAIIVRPKKRPKYRLKELLKDCKPRQLHGETDWGPDMGREVID
jgi:antitoxin MazE